LQKRKDELIQLADHPLDDAQAVRRGKAALTDNVSKFDGSAQDRLTRSGWLRPARARRARSGIWHI
jgi:hypothetical protein